MKVDDDSQWRPDLYDYTDAFRSRVEMYQQKYPKNRLYQQLGHCALEYHCTAAKNVFYPRWECPIPTSPACNSRCIGCISLQASECCPSPQDRIQFMPSAEEIAEVAINHAELAEKPLISFGQGCEGDPALAADNIAAAIKIIRRQCPDLTINFNSNCSIPSAVAKVAEAGANSVRVSLNSVIESTYNAYYRPHGYKFADVVESIDIANKNGLYVALNLLTIPGVNDRKSETDALDAFLTDHHVELIQMRNLNIDAEMLDEALKLPKDEILSVKNMMRQIKKNHKHIKYGYFNRMQDDFLTDRGLPDLRIPKFKKPK
jgi:molybdenum cofactor biosynthesis enzyme MoaA